MSPRSKTRLVFAAMTGTSIDGIDTAAVRISGRGLKARATLLGQASAQMGELTARLRAAQRQEPLTAGAFTALARDLALTHLPPLRKLANVHGKPDLIVLHGQTLFHKPPLSLQLIDASIVAQDFGCAVVSNLRAADLAAGGQGAPITPLSDWMMFRSKASCRAVVNLGGFSNATILPAEPRATGNSVFNPADKRAAWIDGIRGFDLCLCNQLLDHISRTMANIPFDMDGRLALSGRVNLSALEPLHTLLDQQRRAGRSLGTTDEIVAQASVHVSGLSPSDALATAAQAIAQTISHAIAETLPANQRTSRVLVLFAGGGVRNAGLMSAMRRAIKSSGSWKGSVRTTDEYGVPSDARETTAMALLGILAADGVSITLPAVTGRQAIRAIDGAFLLVP